MLKKSTCERRYKSILERSFEIVEDFELNWKSDRKDDIENALKEAKELAGEALFRRLLEIDLLLRIENGAALPKENYLARFPQYVETVDDVFAKLNELSSGVEEEDYPVPKEFEHYRLEEFLGQGVTGCAYRATDLAMRREVAFKFLNPKFDDAESLERFQRELAFNGRLDSDHIVRAYSCGKTADRNWLMMEYVDGDNLERYTLKAPECRLELDEALEIAEQIVLALQTIHEAGLVHRDLKPGNILRRKSDGVVKLSDLGFCVPIAAEKDDDQNQGQFYRPQSDYRGLGETFFFLTTGATFKEPITCPVDVVAVRRAYQKARTPIPSKNVLKFVARTLATDQSAQFGSDEELLRTIRRLIQSRKLKNTPSRLGAIVAIVIVGVGIGAAIFNAIEKDVLIQPQEERPSVVSVGNGPQVDREKEEINEKPLVPDDSSDNSVSSEKNEQNVEHPAVVTQGERVSTIVTTLDDVVDPDDDLISLREAINYAGSDNLGTTITFDSSLTGKTLKIKEVITPKKDVVIDASALYDRKNQKPGVTLDANGSCGFFETRNSLSLVGIALQNGEGGAHRSPIHVSSKFHATDCVFAKCHGVDGGTLLAENCDVTVKHCLFEDNDASNHGGAIRIIAGTASVSDSQFTNNKTALGGGAIWLDHCVDASVINSRFESNSATDGGAVNFDYMESFKVDSCVFIDNEAHNGAVAGFRCSIGEFVASTFSDNKAKYGGGALFLRDSELSIVDSRFSRNEANDGGAMYVNGKARVKNSIFDSNKTVDHDGGAISCGGNLTLEQCALTNNKGSKGGAVLLFDAGTATVVNSLIARNVARNSGGGVALKEELTLINATVVDNFLENGERNDVFSDHGEVEAFNSISSFADWSEAENNLVYDGSQNLFVDPERGDYTLKEGSAAINAGKNERAQGDVDLAGAKRIVDGTVDVGAYERQTAVPIALLREKPSTVVTTLDDVVDPNDDLISLREAIVYAGTSDLGTTITFDSSLKGKTLTIKKVITPEKDVVIDASALYDQESKTPGVTLDAQNACGFFETRNSLSLVGIAFQNGKTVLAKSPIHISSKFRATDCVFANCHGIDGGALLAEGGDVTIERCLFENNDTSNIGGAIRIIGGTASVSDSQFTNNETKSSGGAIWLGHCVDASIVGSRFKNNSATIGGAIGFDYMESFKVDSCDFIDNKAHNGAAASFRSSIGEFVASTFSGNKAKYGGGAIYTDGSDSELSFVDSRFSRNEANNGGAMYVNGKVSVRSSIFDSNKMTDNARGVISCSGDLTLDQCALTNNESSEGGALLLFDSGTATVINSLIARNVARYSGGGIVLQNKLTLVNSTVVDNFLENGERNDVFSDHGEVEAFNSISSFADWSEAENNLVYDSSQNLFVDPESGNYTLKEGSAAINAGKNERAQGDVDLAGGKRVVDGTVDVGAYEYQGSAAK